MRFGNDLLLWEPLKGPDVNKADYMPILASNWINVDVAAPWKNGNNVQNNFQMCRSAINQGKKIRYSCNMSLSNGNLIQRSARIYEFKFLFQISSASNFVGACSLISLIVF